MIAPLDDPDLVATLRALLGAGRYREVVASWLAAPEAEARRSDALLLAATASMRLGDVTRAGELAAEAAEGFRLRADQDGRLRAVNLLGAVAFEQGALDEARTCFEGARALARQLSDTLFEAHAANNLASVAHLRGDATTALSLYRVALLGYQRLGDRRGTAQTYHNLGLAFRELGAWHDADEATVQALRHARMVEDAALAALAMTGRAEVDVARGALDVATRELDRADELALQAGDQLGTAEVGRVRAVLALRLDDPAAAADTARKARKAAEEQGSMLLVAECAAAEAIALRRLARREEAEASRSKAAEVFARLGASALSDRLERDWGLSSWRPPQSPRGGP
jgi:tetratricopeptide (TPR) repeat protein